MICLTTKTILTLRAEARPEGRVLPSNRLMGMRRWMGSHDWIDYGVALLLELLGWDRIFLGFGDLKFR